MLDFDTMLTHVGEFGIYQKMLFIFQAPFCIFVTFVTFGQLFMQIYPTEFWCDDQFDCNIGNISRGQKQNLSLPYFVSDTNCDLNEFNQDYLIAIQRNEQIAAGRVCTNATAPCIFNGTHWYSMPLSGSQYYSHTSADRGIGNNPGSRNKRQSYGNWGSGGGRTYPTSSTTENYYGGGGGGYNNQNFGGADNRPVANPNYNNGRTPLHNPYSTTTSSPYGNYNNNNQGNNQNYNSGGTGNNQYGNGNNNQGFGSGNRENSNNNNNNNGYNPDGRDKYEGNNQGQVTPNQNGNSGTHGTNGIGGKPSGDKNGNDNRPGNTEALKRESCIKEGRTTTISLQPNTWFVLNRVRRTTTPQKRRTLDDCKKVGWERMPSGTNDRYYETIISEGNWWCNAELYNTISQSVFFVGAIVGGFLIGYIADTMGRVPALVIANLIGAIGGILSTFTTNFYLFSFFRFITGMSFDNCFVMMYILVLEFCGPKYRTLVANLSIAVFYTIGTVILPWLALYLNDWRMFGRVIAAPMFLALIAYFIVPESSRWLLSKGKAKRATDILRRFAKVNRNKVDEQIFVDFEEGAQKLYDEIALEGEDPSLMEAFKTPRLRRTFILLVLIWSSIALVYDGHNRNILNLANAEWNLYWMFTLASLTEFPADILLILTLDKFGRRWLAFASLSLSGICSFIAATVPRDAWTATFVMAMCSRFWVNVSFNIGLQYASELLPTVIRAQGVNIIHIMGYVASIISPLIAQVGRSRPVLSLLILGAVALAGGILSLFLSETLGEDLPNNLEEAEAFGKHQSFWNCPICAKPKPAEEEKVVEVPEAVKLRNSLRASSRGETYRSSIISNPNRQSRYGVALDPFPSETSRLKRGYTR